MRYKFEEIFRENENGSITPRFHIRIGAADVGPGITFTKGVAFGGVNIFDFKGLDIEANKEGKALVLKGFYK